MRRTAAHIAILWLAALILAAGAKGDDTTPRVDPFTTDHTIPALDQLASYWARYPVRVECPADWQSWDADPDAVGSFGYTYLDADWTRVQPPICELAQKVSSVNLDRPWGDYDIAVSVHVIVHESWHLRLWAGRADEARVECKAIKSDYKSFLRLGASPEQAEHLYSLAWAFHVREGVLFGAYHLKGCGARKPRDA